MNAAPLRQPAFATTVAAPDTAKRFVRVRPPVSRPSFAGALPADVCIAVTVMAVCFTVLVDLLLGGAHSSLHAWSYAFAAVHFGLAGWLGTRNSRASGAFALIVLGLGALASGVLGGVMAVLPSTEWVLSDAAIPGIEALSIALAAGFGGVHLALRSRHRSAR